MVVGVTNSITVNKLAKLVDSSKGFASSFDINKDWVTLHFKIFKFKAGVNIKVASKLKASYKVNGSNCPNLVRHITN